MTKRAVLNVSSTKKRDTLVPYTNTTVATPSGGTTYNVGPAIITGDLSAWMFPFICTARSMDSTTSGSNPTIPVRGIAGDPSTRASSTCYMKGYSEKILLQTNDGMPWAWRRIVFNYKGGTIASTQNSGFSLYTLTNAGYTRVVNQTTNTTIIASLMFQGTQGTDWTDYFDAPTDTRNITIMSDKTRSIAGGNEDGIMRVYKDYIPMNKNLVYADDESGGGLYENTLSTLGKPGMGDVYIVDMFRARFGATNSSRLTFHPQGCLYWHEK